MLCLLLAFPLAYVIAFKAGRYKNLILGLVILPFFVTFLIRTIAWKTILADDGWVVSALGAVGLLPDEGRLLSTSWAVIGGLTYNWIIFMILPLYVSLEKIDPRLLEASKDLYSSNRRSFGKVILPLSMPGVLAGSMLVFIPAVGDFINADYLGSTQTTMIGNVIQKQFLVVKDYPAAAALSDGADGDHPGRRAALHPGARHGGPGMTTQAMAEADQSGAGENRQGQPEMGRPDPAGRRRPGAALSVPADLRDHPVLVQRPEGQVQLLVAGLHPRQLGATRSSTPR